MQQFYQQQQQRAAVHHSYYSNYFAVSMAAASVAAETSTSDDTDVAATQCRSRRPPLQLGNMIEQLLRQPTQPGHHDMDRDSGLNGSTGSSPTSLSSCASSTSTYDIDGHHNDDVDEDEVICVDDCDDNAMVGSGSNGGISALGNNGDDDDDDEDVDVDVDDHDDDDEEDDDEEDDDGNVADYEADDDADDGMNRQCRAMIQRTTVIKSVIANDLYLDQQMRMQHQQQQHMNATAAVQMSNSIRRMTLAVSPTDSMSNGSQRSSGSVSSESLSPGHHIMAGDADDMLIVCKWHQCYR